MVPTRLLRFRARANGHTVAAFCLELEAGIRGAEVEKDARGSWGVRGSVDYSEV